MAIVCRFRLSDKTTREITDDDFQNLERYVILLYDRSSTLENVNECRKELFTKKGRSIDNLPPTRDALFQHSKRALLQARYAIVYNTRAHALAGFS